MPNGIFPVPQFHSHRSDRAGRRSGLALRVRTRLRRARLDDRLARGSDPATNAELKLRAAQLRSPAVRLELANALVKALGDARGPNLEPYTAKGRRQRAEILACSDDVQALALRLRDKQPIDVRGAAMAAQLLSGGGATSLDRLADRDLGKAVRGARLALDPTAPVRQDLQTAA